MSDDRQILVEFPKEQSEEFLQAFAENEIDHDDAEEISALDGASVIQIVLTITPILAPAIAKLLSTWINRPEVTVKDGVAVYKGYTAEDVATIMSAEKDT